MSGRYTFQPAGSPGAQDPNQMAQQQQQQQQNFGQPQFQQQPQPQQQPMQMQMPMQMQPQGQYPQSQPQPQMQTFGYGSPVQMQPQMQPSPGYPSPMSGPLSSPQPAQYGFPPQSNFGSDPSSQMLAYSGGQGSFGQLPFMPQPGMSFPQQYPAAYPPSPQSQPQYQHQQPQYQQPPMGQMQPQYPQSTMGQMQPSLSPSSSSSQLPIAQPQFFPSGTLVSRPGPPPGAILSPNYSYEEFVPNGPVVVYRIFRSRVVGALVRGDSNELGFMVFSIKLRDVEQFFDKTKLQGWNRNYESAIKIFGPSIKSSAVRAGITIQHNTLYSGEDKLHESERELRSGDEFLRLVQFGEWNNLRRRFTYVITADDTFRFSETGTAFFKDFASKHAVHANASTEVLYAGEFHIGKYLHPDGTAFRWLIIDNNSGTYAPNKELLPKLRGLMAHNFPGLYVEALDFSDPNLKEYMRRF